MSRRRKPTAASSASGPPSEAAHERPCARYAIGVRVNASLGAGSRRSDPGLQSLLECPPEPCAQVRILPGALAEDQQKSGADQGGCLDERAGPSVTGFRSLSFAQGVVPRVPWGGGGSGSLRGWFRTLPCGWAGGGRRRRMPLAGRCAGRSTAGPGPGVAGRARPYGCRRRAGHHGPRAHRVLDEQVGRHPFRPRVRAPPPTPGSTPTPATRAW
jgi:hypothetical protein